MNTRTMLAVVAAVVASMAVVTAAPTHADNLPMHHVRYTLTAENPIWANVYYLDQEPEVFANWSHNPYQYMPNIQTDLGPSQSWSFELNLQKPEQWAMVMANTGPEPGTPNFACQIEVDGNVVVSKTGGKGVLCSIRPW